MDIKQLRKMCQLILLAGALLCTDTVSIEAQTREYRIGAEDVLEISFFQDPSLDASVRVGLDGKITLDIVGQIQASGKTTEELQSDIIRQMSRLNKDISQTVVRVVAFNYNHVFVIGQVNQPGKRTFEEIPDLWAIINEAGGVGEFGDLSRVTIIRGGADAGKVEVVNVAQAIAKNEVDKLPKIRRGDTIEVPRTAGQMPSANLGQTTQAKNLVYVIGAVTRPGQIGFEDNMDILELLSLAGGPTENADLKKAKIITKDGFYSQTLRFDLEKQFNQNLPARYTVRREDTFVIPPKGTGFLGLTLTNASIVLGTITSIVILLDRLSGNGNTVTR